MQSKVVTDRQLSYEGHQLRPHWLYQQFDLLGDAAVAFVGPCQVVVEQMVDLADVKAAAPIYSPLMLHIIAEFFDTHLELAIHRQRLLIVHAQEWLASEAGIALQREGDDLYGKRPDGTTGKLSVSIATISPVSTLLHVGFNIETAGTPVPTVGLAQWGIKSQPFAQALLARFAAELAEIQQARCKVRAVGTHRTG